MADAAPAPTSPKDATATTSPKGDEVSSTRITSDLRGFYAQHGVDVDRLVEGEGSLCFASRFVRLNPSMDKSETLEKLKVRHVLLFLVEPFSATF